jgi:hypothetical protein
MGLSHPYNYEPLWQARKAELREARALHNRTLGDAASVISQAITVINESGEYLPTIQHILEDPDLPGLIRRVETLRSFEPPADPNAPDSGPGPGIGLHQFLGPFDLYLKIKQYPIIPWLVGVGLLTLIGGIGYAIGKRGK